MTPIFPAGLAIQASTDSYELAEALSHQWEIKTTQIEKGRYNFRVQGIHTQQVQAARVLRSLGTRLDGKVPHGTVTMAMALNRDARIQFRGRRLEPLDLIVQSDADGLDFSFVGGVELLTIAVNREELDRRAMAQWGKPFPCVSRFGILRFLDEPVSQHIRNRVVSALADALKSPKDYAAKEPSRRFDDTILEALFNNLEDQSKAMGRADRHRAAKRAVEFLQTHCREELSMTDLCEAIGANRRTLHLAFLEIYGMSPMRYHRALKLCGARMEIKKARKTERTITDVAMGWGFNHLGRFSAYYRDFFGELPSVEYGLSMPNSAIWNGK